VATRVLAYTALPTRTAHGKTIMKYTQTFALSLALFATAACDNKPAEGKTKALVEEVAQAPAPAPVATAEAGKLTSYSFSQDNSKVEFTGAKVTGKHLGSFKTFSGTIRAQTDNADASAGSVNVEIQVASIEADVEKLTAHLKTPDLLDAEKFPKATFSSTKIEKKDGTNYSVTGTFQLHGVSKQITFPATIRVAPEQVEADAEFAINRKDFGITYPGKPDDLISDDVLIKLTIRAPRAAS
jgi:polyisoprenoid-binding protein YceI